MNSSDWRTPGVVLACGSIILMLSLGIRQSFGLFLQPMSSELGWGRETFAFALALQNLIWGVAQPFVGMIADMFGTARVIVAAGLSVLAAVLCLPIDERELATLPVRRPAV
jgi:sugar phosphate permease